MSEKSELTKRVLECQKTGQGIEALVNDIAVKVYFYAGKERRTSQTTQTDDEYCNFFLSIFPRIPGLIKRFEDRGVPFESYLAATIKYQWKTFEIKRSKELSRQKTIVSEEKSRYSTEPAPPIPLPAFLSWQDMIDDQGRMILDIENGSKPIPPTTGRRLLFAACKSAYFLTDDQIRMLAECLEMDYGEVSQKLLNLRQLVHSRSDRYYKLENRRTRLFTMIIETEDRITALDEPERSALLRKSNIYRERLDRLSETISHISLTPTNQEIAAELGVPKGTVDSGLYYLKQKLQHTA